MISALLHGKKNKKSDESMITATAGSVSINPKNLEKFITKHHRFKAKIHYQYEELKEIMDAAQSIFRQESVCLEDIPLPVNVVGDIHGQFPDLQRIFTALGYPGKSNYLFLGDYVDRGTQSLNCIGLLLAYKIAYPRRIFMLRGNHESACVNMYYGFLSECKQAFGFLADQVYREMNEVFSYMPFSAIIKHKILCFHGGLSPHLKSVNDLRNIPRPCYEPRKKHIEEDLVWADPAIACKGFRQNAIRGISVCFGEDVVQQTCDKLKLDLIIRAHQVMPNGYGFYANRKLITVFSAPRYIPEINNKGGVVKISLNMMISFAIFNPATKTCVGPEAFKRSFEDAGSVNEPPTMPLGEQESATQNESAIAQ